MNCRMIGQNCSLIKSRLSVPSNLFPEVIIFGKGVGECILIKSKSGEYIVIDSFLDKDSNRPIVLDYLDKFAIPYSQIKMVVVSHWHKDHIDGIAQIIEAAGKGVEVVINPIIKKKKYQQFLANQVAKVNSEADEFGKVMSLISKNQIKKIVPIIDKPIYCKSRDDIKLTALSPVDEEFNCYIEKLLDNLAGDKSTDKIPDENLLSIVLLLDFNGESFLLSSDMENRKESGWQEIINNYKECLYTKAKYYKVPHHGSKTGENIDVWNKLLIAKPLSFATLFNKCNLPSDEDINRIAENSKCVFVIGEKNKRDDAFERDLRKNSFDQKAYSLSKKIGIARVIFDGNPELNIECVGAVTEYSKIEKK